MQYSVVDCEVLGLKFATDANNYYLYAAPIINVYTDCSALEGIFNKNLGDIKNKRIRDMVERMMGYNFKFHHISGKKNEIADCFSRLTRRIREAEHFCLEEPILADRSVIKKIGLKTKFQAEMFMGRKVTSYLREQRGNSLNPDLSPLDNR